MCFERHIAQCKCVVSKFASLVYELFFLDAESYFQFIVTEFQYSENPEQKTD